MKQTIFISLLSLMAVASLHSQVLRTANTEALSNNGVQWVKKQLPPSIITFSDYSGQVNIKVPISSLFTPASDSFAVQSPADTLADFMMILDKEQVQQPTTRAKTFSTSGWLTINNISKKTEAQCILEPRTDPASGFLISIVIKFDPYQFGLRPAPDSDQNNLMVVRVSNGYINRLASY